MKHAQVRQLWEERISSFTHSGMNVKTWCATNNIPVVTFQYWRKKLLSPTPSTSWIPVNVVEEARPVSQTGVKIRLGDVVIEVETGFDHQVLRSVVDILRS